MKVSQKLYNEKLKSPSRSILMALGGIGIILFVLYLVGLTGRRRGFHGDAWEWVFFAGLAAYILWLTAFGKTLEWIYFDYQRQVIEIMTSTLITKEKTQQIAIADIRYKIGKEGKRFTPYIDVYNRKQKVIRLSRNGIGERTFDLISQEFSQLAS